MSVELMMMHHHRSPTGAFSRAPTHIAAFDLLQQTTPPFIFRRRSTPDIAHPLPLASADQQPARSYVQGLLLALTFLAWLFFEEVEALRQFLRRFFWFS